MTAFDPLRSLGWAAKKQPYELSASCNHHLPSRGVFVGKTAAAYCDWTAGR